MFGSRSFFRRQPVRVLLTSLIFSGMAANGAPPAWWSGGSSPVWDPDLSLSPDVNKGVANVGQAKNMVQRALEVIEATDVDLADEIRTKLTTPQPSVLNPELTNPPVLDLTVPAEKTQAWLTKQKSPVLLGQLKAIAKPFYDALHAEDADWLDAKMVENGTKDLQISSHYYPWSYQPNDDQNQAPATIGQLKAVFSLDLDLLPGGDADGDGLTNAEEMKHGTQPRNPDSDGDGINDWNEIQYGTNPNDPTSSSIPPGVGNGEFVVYAPDISVDLDPNQTTTVPIFLKNDTNDPVSYTTTLSSDESLYTYRDSDSGAIPNSEWEEISETGIHLNGVSGGYGVSEVITFSSSFQFRFDGVNYSQVRVGSNGLISFGNNLSTQIHSGIPTAANNLGGFIAPLWSDLDPGAHGDVYWKEEDNRVIIQYQEVIRKNAPDDEDSYTFQVVLYSDGRIQFRYGSLYGPVDSCTVGIQNAPKSIALEAAYDEEYLRSHMVVEFYPPFKFFSREPASGTVLPHSVAVVTGTFESRNLQPGTSFQANLSISPTNSSNFSTVILAPTLTIAGDADNDGILDRVERGLAEQLLEIMTPEELDGLGAGVLQEVTAGNLDKNLDYTGSGVTLDDYLKMLMSAPPSNSGFRVECREKWFNGEAVRVGQGDVRFERIGEDTISLPLGVVPNMEWFKSMTEQQPWETWYQSIERPLMVHLEAQAGYSSSIDGDTSRWSGLFEKRGFRLWVTTLTDKPTRYWIERVKAKHTRQPGFPMDYDETRSHVLVEIGAGKMCSDWIDIEAPMESNNPFNWKVSLVSMPLHPAIQETSGLRFRRVGLDGVPVPAEKDQAKEETDETNEETYVDTLTLGLRHDTSDIYIPLPGGELSLAVKRSIQPEVWSDDPGWTPEFGERPRHWMVRGRPFGAGWSSGITPHIRMEYHSGAVPIPSDTIEVTDENGATHRFARIFDRSSVDPEGPDLGDGDGLDGKVRVSFLPLPSNRSEADTFRNRLYAVLSGTGSGATVEKVVFTRKFGTTLNFDPSVVAVEDIALSETQSKKVKYLRLLPGESVVDRFGNVLNYQYGSNSEDSLIPETITWHPRGHSPSKQLKITSTQHSGHWLVDKVEDPRGNIWTYNYIDTLYGETGGNTYQLLQSVIAPAGGVTTYGYDMPEAVLDTFVTHDHVEGEPVRQTYCFHIALNSVSVGGGNVMLPRADPANVAPGLSPTPNWTGHSKITTIHYDWDHSTRTYDSSLFYWPIDRHSSRSRIVGAVESSGVKTLRVIPDLGDPVQFNLGDPAFENLGVKWRMKGQRKAAFIDALGNRRIFRYSDPLLTDNQEIERYFDLNADVIPRAPLVGVLWQTCSMTHPDGVTETATFDVNAGMADSVVVDHSRNVTKYEHADTYKVRDFVEWLPESVDENPLFSANYSEPTSETRIDRLGGKSYTKTFSYFSSGSADPAVHRAPASRVMVSETDALGRETEWTVDGSTGRREREYVREADGTLVRRTDFEYGNANFKGFVTRTTVKDATRNDGSVNDLVKDYEPDTHGNVRKTIVHPGGLNLVTQATYDSNNNRTSETDPKGNITRFVYDEANRLVGTVIPAALQADGTTQPSVILERGYTPTGKVFWTTDAKGTVSLTEYDSRDRPVKTAVATGLGSNLQPKTNGIIPESLPAGTIVTQEHYNNLDLPVLSVDPRGVVTRTSYDILSRPTMVAVDPSGLNLRTTFDYSGPNAGGGAFANTTFKPTTVTDPAGFRTIVEYDGLYRPVVTRTEYDKSSGRFAVSRNVYDDAGNILRKHSWRSHFSANGNVPASGDLVTTSTYDALNRPLVVTEGDGSGLATVTTTSYTATAPWKVHKQDGSIIRVTETDYDRAGRPVKVWSPAATTGLVDRGHPTDPVLGSGVVTTGYDDNSNPISVKDALGQITRTAYDSRNRAIRVAVNPVTGNPADPTGSPGSNDLLTRSYYDQNGNAIAVTDPRGNTTTTAYDRAGRSTSVTTPAVPVHGETNPVALISYIQYDANGNVLMAQDNAGNKTRNCYDTANRLIASATNPVTGDPADPSVVPAPDDIVVRNEYDNQGNLTKVTDGLSQVTGFTYDGLKRKLSTIWDQGSSRAKTDQIATYDALVQLTATDALGREKIMHYDDRHRLTGIQAAGVASQSRTLVLDRAGRITKVLHGGHGLPPTTALTADVRNVGTTPDALDRIVSETSAGVTHTDTWDKAGNRLSITYGNTGRKLVSQYDKLNRLDKLSEKLPAESTWRVTDYDYDANGNVLTKTHENGTVDHTTYDALNRRETSSVTAGATTLSSFGFKYSKASAVAWIQENYDPSAGIVNRTVTNTYDRVYRLTGESAVDAAKTVLTAYGYDKANNRTSRTITTTPAGGSTTVATDNYTYGNSSNGKNSNQLADWEKPDLSHVTYSYDDNGNRTGRSETIGGTLKTDVYTYDFWNRLTSLNLQSKASGVNGTYGYAYDHRARRVVRDESGISGRTRDLVVFGSGISAQEYANQSGQSPSGSPAVEYVRGSDWGGGVGGILYSARGSTLSWANYNGRGDVVTRTSSAGALTYAASYEAFGKRTQENGTNPDRQCANTKDEDPTGLLNEGFRYRDIELGMFISRDPAGFVDGPNTYTYVSQNPWSGFDPEGLTEWNPFKPKFRDEGVQRLKGAGDSLWNAGAGILQNSGPKVMYDIFTGAKTQEVKTSWAGWQKAASNPQAAFDGAYNSVANEVNYRIHDPRGQGKLLADLALIFLTKKVGGAAVAESRVVSSELAVATGKTGRVIASETVEAVGEVTTKMPPQFPSGSFSITELGWQGYPAGVPKPAGPFRLIEGAEYKAARSAANSANNKIRMQQDLRQKSVDVHEVQPVKFGGAATDPANKMILDRDLHRKQVTPWWNQLMRDIEVK